MNDYTEHKSSGEIAIERLFARIPLTRSRETCDPKYAARAAGFWLQHQAVGEARARV